jgi:cbb3-type cytochrome oxidase cytochrome c subunit
VYLRVGTFSFRGRVRICVTGPRGPRVCHSYPLRALANGMYEAKARWHGNYPSEGAGTYRVAFFWGATRLGPVLSFRV